MSNSAPRYLWAIAEHSRCQPGRPDPHGVSHCGSPGLAPFHSAKSRGSRLPRSLAVGGGEHVVDALAGQRAVRVERAHVEVDVAAGRVRVVAVDQPPHQRDHLGDVPGRPGLVRRRQAAQRVVRPGEGALVAHGQLPVRDVLVAGVVDDLVVDVGDVADEGDDVAAVLEPAAQHVEGEPGADVPDVRRGLDGGAAQVDADPAGDERHEVAHRPGGGVVQAKGHGRKGTGRRPLGRPGRGRPRGSGRRGQRSSHPGPGASTAPIPQTTRCAAGLTCAMGAALRKWSRQSRASRSRRYPRPLMATGSPSRVSTHPHSPVTGLRLSRVWTSSSERTRSRIARTHASAPQW